MVFEDFFPHWKLSMSGGELDARAPISMHEAWVLI